MASNSIEKIWKTPIWPDSISFPGIKGGVFCSSTKNQKWTFRTLADVHGHTRYYIGHGDDHCESWNEVIKDVFLKVQYKLAISSPPPAANRGQKQIKHGIGKTYYVMLLSPVTYEGKGRFKVKHPITPHPTWICPPDDEVFS